MTFKREVVIGLEIHLELNTKSKLFCSCATQGSDAPNTRTCPVCLGHPGSKPVVNKKALLYTARLAKALGCSIAPKAIFSRKSYFYPDLAKNFQITQYEDPVGKDGRLPVHDTTVGITRVHLEEDPASLIHSGAYVLVDYNRSGNPLCEIVTEPDMSSPQEARDMLRSLITLVQYLGIHDPQKNLIKADANVSIRPDYVRTEIKNISGFKELERALEYEISRQQALREEKKKIVQETRGWYPDKQVTRTLRKKETEEDYGYIYDPDLVPVNIEDAIVVPELPWDKKERYRKLGLSSSDAQVISADMQLAQIFDKVSEHVSVELAAKWIRRELPRVLGYHKKSVEDIDAEEFMDILRLLDTDNITDMTAQKLLELLVEEGIDVKVYVKDHNLEAVTDTSSLQQWAQESIEENPSVVEDYIAGKQEAINYLMGQVMKRSRGKADPKKVKDMLKKLIST